MENKNQVQEVETVKTPLWKKIISIVLNTLFYIFIVFMLTFAIANISSKNKNNIPNIFGIGFLNVISDSMEGTREDSFFIGDLLIVKMANEQRISNLTPQKDMITFLTNDNSGNPIVVTHRLVDIIEGEGGIKTYVTQGDYVEIVNSSAVYDPESGNLYLCETMFDDDILAVYSGKIVGGGKVLSFLQSTTGFGLCIVLPTALLLIYQGYVLVKNVMELNRQKIAQAKIDFDPEEEKRKIREQLLKELKEQEQKEKENNE